MSSDMISRAVLARSPELPQEVVGWLLDRCGPNLSRYKGRGTGGPLPSQASELIRRHGYKMAVVVANLTADSQLLAKLAKNSSVQVRRAVANNPHTDQPTHEYLWRWVLAAKDQKVQDSVARALPFDVLLSSAEPLPIRSNRSSPADNADRLLTGRGHAFNTALTSSPAHSAVLSRLRYGTFPGEASTPATSADFRAAITHDCPMLALQATVLCASNLVDGLSFAEASKLFAASHRVLGTGSPETVERRLVAACVRHALLDAATAIDVALAEQAVSYRDLITSDPAAVASPGYGVWEATHLSPPAFGPRVTAAAVDVFLDSAVPEYCVAAVLSAAPAQLRRLMSSMVLPPRVLQAVTGQNPESLPADLVVETLRAYQQQAIETGVFVPISYDVLSVAVDVPLDLLRWLLRNLGGTIVSDFASGRFKTKPSPGFLTELVAEATENLSPEWTWGQVEHRVACRVLEWAEQPWATELLGILPLRLFDSSTSADFAAARLTEEFGTYPQLWSTALDFMDSHFPGSLPDLIDMVWAVAGDGMVRPSTA